MVDKSEPIKVGSIPEEYSYIASLRCDRCGDAYRVVRQSLLVGGTVPMDAIEIICRTCEQEKHLLFDIASFFGK
jgi:hypothetical protein